MNKYEKDLTLVNGVIDRLQARLLVKKNRFTERCLEKAQGLQRVLLFKINKTKKQ